MNDFILELGELNECRRAHYFPASEGYRLRFSVRDLYIGFKDPHLEQLATISPDLPGSPRISSRTCTSSSSPAE